MGFIGSLFSGDKGAGFQASDPSGILSPENRQAANNATNAAFTGLTQQQQFLNALQAQNGIANQSNVYNQLQGVANGTGPNPAQAMLNNSTGQNIANQTAAMASQRGAGANPALIARQAAQQGGALQQNAVGQGAALQAQQQLGALGQLGGIAGQQVGQQGAALNGLNQYSQGLQGNLFNAQVGAQSNINNANAGIAAQNANAQKGVIGGLMNGVGAGGAALLAGPAAVDPGGGNAVDKFTGNSSSTSQFGGLGGNYKFAEGGQVGGPQSHIHAYFAKGGEAKKVDTMVSPGEKILSRKEAKEVAENKKSLGSVGKKVPGEAKVKGDSLENDTVPMKQSEGGFVIPRSIMESKDPAKHAAKFVQAHMTIQDYKKNK